VSPSSSVTPLEGIQRRAVRAEVVAIGTDTPAESELDRVGEADVAVVVAGLTYAEEGEYIPAGFGGDFAEGGDRADLELPAAQVELIRAVSSRAARTVVVLEAGSALTMGDWIDDVDAVLMAWYPGMAGGTAIAEILFGDVNPGGKTPVTFPKSLAQLPEWDIASDEVDYGFLHGYRLLDANDDEPLFPFGHGLGYTRFALGRAEVSAATLAPDGAVIVSVDVFNAGERAGAEVVQIYASVPRSRVARVPRALVGFRRIELEAGAVASVRIEVSARDLAYWDSSAGGWVVEPAEYVLHVGTSSRHLPLAMTVAIE
jgi:beta-glucosidase